jgi:hypothetical protein
MTRIDGNRGTADPRDPAALHSKIRRSAWVLGLLAVTFYLGFIAWNVFRGLSGGG